MECFKGSFRLASAASQRPLYACSYRYEAAEIFSEGTGSLVSILSPAMLVVEFLKQLQAEALKVLMR